MPDLPQSEGAGAPPRPTEETTIRSREAGGAGGAAGAGDALREIVEGNLSDRWERGPLTSLYRWHLEGLRPRSIAERLNAEHRKRRRWTRNAVIGKLNRTKGLPPAPGKEPQKQKASPPSRRWPKAAATMAQRLSGAGRSAKEIAARLNKRFEPASAYSAGSVRRHLASAGMQPTSERAWRWREAVLARISEMAARRTSGPEIAAALNREFKPETPYNAHSIYHVARTKGIRLLGRTARASGCPQAREAIGKDETEATGAALPSKGGERRDPCQLEEEGADAKGIGDGDADR